MLGTYYDSEKCMEVPDKEPVQLNRNFYRAIIEAEKLLGGKATLVSNTRKSALIVPHSGNLRLLLSEG